MSKTWLLLWLLADSHTRFYFCEMIGIGTLSFTRLQQELIILMHTWIIGPHMEFLSPPRALYWLLCPRRPGTWEGVIRIESHTLWSLRAGHVTRQPRVRHSVSPCSVVVQDWPYSPLVLNCSQPLGLYLFSSFFLSAFSVPSTLLSQTLFQEIVWDASLK